MSPRIVIRNLSGSKASSTEEFSDAGLREIAFGRESGCQVQYDKERDDLVRTQFLQAPVRFPGGLAFILDP